MPNERYIPCFSGSNPVEIHALSWSKEHPYFGVLVLFRQMNCCPAQESTIRYLCIDKPAYRGKMLKALDARLTARII